MTVSTYSTGTVSITALGTTVTSASGSPLWLSNIAEGDELIVDSKIGVRIISVTDDTHFVIDKWTQGAVAGAAYVIRRSGVTRFSGSALSIAVNKLIADINTAGYIIPVPTASSAPDVSAGIELQYAIKPSTSEIWQRQSGIWVSLGTSITNGLVQSFTNTTEATGAGTTYAAKFAGGVEILKKLYVTGAVSLASTLGVTGAATLSSTLALAGNLAINTNKFTVDAATGNTVVAGTLVAGAVSSSGDITWTGAAYTAYNPTPVATTGAFTTATVASRYKVFGKKCHWYGILTPDAGGSGRAKIALPVSRNNTVDAQVGSAVNTATATPVYCGQLDLGGSISITVSGAQPVFFSINYEVN